MTHLERARAWLEVQENSYITCVLGILVMGKVFDFHAGSVLFSCFAVSMMYLLRAIRTAPKPTFYVIDNSVFEDEKVTHIKSDSGPIVVMTRETMETFEGEVKWTRKDGTGSVKVSP